jgi:hypothetical protein
VQAYVDQYPDEVAGVVMVDRATAEYFVSLGQSDEEIAAVEGNTDIAYLVTMIGIPRLLNFIPSPVSNDLPPDIRPTYDATVFQTRYYASLGEELRNLGSNYRFAASLPPSAAISRWWSWFMTQPWAEIQPNRCTMRVVLPTPPAILTPVS